MRIWDLPVSKLCDKHLLGEHRELHAIWAYLTTDKGGSYRKHPETLRWKGEKMALFWRHQYQVVEMVNRGFKHNSPLRVNKLNGLWFNTKIVNTLEEQISILKAKGCKCQLN